MIHQTVSLQHTRLLFYERKKFDHGQQHLDAVWNNHNADFVSVCINRCGTHIRWDYVLVCAVMGASHDLVINTKEAGVRLPLIDNKYLHVVG